ncbi:MAG: hypothetical protein KTR15_03170 [Phycisphaeraceae bacterium]|nr:hypothetical protein [Phycisphaeraceae bacterium]
MLFWFDPFLGDDVMSEAAAPSSPTTPPVVSGVVDEVHADWLQVRMPGTDYRLRLVPAEGLSAAVGDKVQGIVRAQALRMDVIPAGGRYIEPVQGRPRRIQGRAIGGNVANNEVYIKAGPGVVVTPMAPQRASDFSIGQMVSFDVRTGATIEVGS